ncbi:hypothetical protein [Lachnoclostridium phytofermentans]|nr:hypothetical protein [Lachnoclostridium phytofermentans]
MIQIHFFVESMVTKNHEGQGVPENIELDGMECGEKYGYGEVDGW